MIPGEIVLALGDVVLDVGRATLIVDVDNSTDRPVQVGSHHEFSELNDHVGFDRARTLGHRLRIPAGDTLRFEPRTTRSVVLVETGDVR